MTHDPATAPDAAPNPEAARARAVTRLTPLAGARKVLVAVMWRPWLWPAAVAEALRMATPGWWRKWPPIPLPDEVLWGFRIETAYGSDRDATLSPPEVRSFLEWCLQARNWKNI
jgi:hypothetical protein